MHPYDGHGLSHMQKIYNYRLSHARRIVECTFGVLSSMWGTLMSAMHLGVENAIKVVLACCVFHNFVIEKESTSQTQHLFPLRKVCSLWACGPPPTHALHIRNAFANFSVSVERQLAWQNEYILSVQILNIHFFTLVLLLLPCPFENFREKKCRLVLIYHFQRFCS